MWWPRIVLMPLHHPAIELAGDRYGFLVADRTRPRAQPLPLAGEFGGFDRVANFRLLGVALRSEHFSSRFFRIGRSLAGTALRNQ
jgi:hypothetical protein